MACVKVFGIFVFLTLVNFCFVNCSGNPSRLIYRKYEKKHPKKNYVQIVEIFGTQQIPPHYTKSDKELNDFLARDSYKTDMNCTKTNQTESVETTTTVNFPTIPTTAVRLVTTTQKPAAQRPTTKSTSIRTPNLNELFTIPMRPTRPTIQPNPPENKNPDYSNVIPWTNVIVTKHPPSTNTPIIVIQETDDLPTNKKTTYIDIDRDFRGNLKPLATTTEISLSRESSDDEVIYKTDEEKEYSEDNYPDVIPSDQFEGADYTDDNEDYDENNDEDYEGEILSKRRKRQKKKSGTTLMRKNTTKS
jgi:hypothetical protein